VRDHGRTMWTRLRRRSSPFCQNLIGEVNNLDLGFHTSGMKVSKLRTTSHCTSMVYITTLIRPHTVHRWFYDHSDTTSHCTSMVYITTLIRPYTVHRWFFFPFHQFNITYYSCCLVPVWRL